MRLYFRKLYFYFFFFWFFLYTFSCTLEPSSINILPTEITRTIVQSVAKPPRLNKTLGHLRVTCKTFYNVIHAPYQGSLLYNHPHTYIFSNTIFNDGVPFDFETVAREVKGILKNSSSILSLSPYDIASHLIAISNATRQIEEKYSPPIIEKVFLKHLAQLGLCNGLEREDDPFGRLETLMTNFNIGIYHKYYVRKTVLKYFVSRAPVTTDLTSLHEIVCSLYGAERADAITCYGVHLQKYLTKFKSDLENAHDNEDADHAKFHINFYGNKLRRLLLISNNGRGLVHDKKTLLDLDAELLLRPTTKETTIIKEPARVITFFETLYILDKNYAISWFKLWFSRAMTLIDMEKSSRAWSEMVSMFRNDKLPCPLFVQLENQQTIYDILKEKNYHYYYGDTEQPLLKSALRHYFAFSSLEDIKRDEASLYGIFDDLIEIIDEDVFMPWGKGIGDYYYKTPLIVLSLLKTAGVYFYQEARLKCVQKLFFKNMPDIDFNINPVRLCRIRLPDDELPGLTLANYQTIIFIDFSDPHSLYSLIDTCSKEGKTKEQLAPIVFAWIRNHKGRDDTEKFLSLLAENNDLHELYDKVQEYEPLNPRPTDNSFVQSTTSAMKYRLKRLFVVCLGVGIVGFCALSINSMIRRSKDK